MPSEEYLKEIKKKIKEAGEKQLRELDLTGGHFSEGQLTQILVKFLNWSTWKS